MLAYWAKNLATISAMPIARTTPVEPHISGHAIVNDLPIKVMFDTGADRSTLKLSTALKAGGKLAADAASADDALRGIGSHAIDSYIIPFSSFEVGNETIKNIRLRVARSDFTGADMLLGADFFLSHRVLVSQSQHRLYFTYNGGPVFRLDDAGVRSNPFATVAPAADQKSAMAAGEEKAAGLDADALRRRAAAAEARRDFANAFADLDRAIALEPKNAELYYDRALWRLASRAPANVGADIETALRLKPDYANALILRAHMRLATGEMDKAGADFDAAVKAAPDRPDLELEAAHAYAQAREFDRAIARYDAWIGKYPGSFEMVDALNGRCWTRALWGRDLDKAVADCNQAMRRGAKLAEVLDSRGMVRLRRGEFVQAIGDYDAALKLQPKLAPSLYGRSLAKQKAGDSAGAAADLQAAAAIEPDIADRMKALGITETTVVVATLH
jgi:tetratricopeptide (TPR) repeat protein